VNAAFLPLPGGATAVYNASGLNRYRHPDWLGSSRIASTTARTVSYDAAYSPFGESYAESGSTDRNFTGQNQDLAGDMYDFMYRQYHAPQGRWVSPDPAGTSAVNPANPQSWNRYAYVNGSPLNSVDPLGLCGDGSDETDGGTCAPTYYPPNDGMGTWRENNDEGNWLPDAWKGYGPGASTQGAGINVGGVWGSGQIGTSMIYSMDQVASVDVQPGPDYWNRLTAAINAAISAVRPLQKGDTFAVTVSPGCPKGQSHTGNTGVCDVPLAPDRVAVLTGSVKYTPNIGAPVNLPPGVCLALAFGGLPTGAAFKMTGAALGEAGLGATVGAALDTVAAPVGVGMVLVAAIGCNP